MVKLTHIESHRLFVPFMGELQGKALVRDGGYYRKTHAEAILVGFIGSYDFEVQIHHNKNYTQ